MSPPNGKTDSPISRNIRRLRTARGWSQQGLADRAGQSSIKQIERGKNVGRIGTLTAVAEALGVSVGDLLADQDAPIPPKLESFLLSPGARDITPDEADKLRWVPPFQGKTPTETTYYLALQMLRPMEKKDATG